MNYTIDFEFDGYKGKSLTMGLVCENGTSIYLGKYSHVFPTDELDVWVQANVVPFIDCAFIPIQWLPVNAFGLAIEEFLKGDPNPHIIADWPDVIKYFCEEIITGPGTMINIPAITFEVKRVNTYPTKVLNALQHNSWWDAVVLMRYCEENKLLK